MGRITGGTATHRTAARVAGRVAIVGVIALALAGCTSPASFSHPGPASPPASGPAVATHSTPAPASRATVTSSPQQKRAAALDAGEATIAAAHPARGLVVMQTTLATPDGATSMHLAVVAAGDDTYELHISDFRSTSHDDQTLFLRQFPEQVGSCVEDGISFGTTNWNASSTDPVEKAPPAVVDLSDAGDDPSFVKTAVITDFDQGGSSGCMGYPVVAAVPLTWHTPNRHPGLVVRDSGSAPGARGSVTLTNGVPHFYTIAAGDTVIGLESRFGVSKRDLVSLTARNHGVGWGELKTGEQLNLDPALR